VLLLRTETDTKPSLGHFPSLSSNFNFYSHLFAFIFVSVVPIAWLNAWAMLRDSFDTGQLIILNVFPLTIIDCTFQKARRKDFECFQHKEMKHI
jgi:hypothetical protein